MPFQSWSAAAAAAAAAADDDDDDVIIVYTGLTLYFWLTKLDIASTLKRR